MVVIWGLDLKEMQWGKFKSSYMFGNTDYHLRRTKFAVYQAAMLSCIVSESLGTAVLENYVSQQNGIKKLDPLHRAVLYNDDYVGMASFNIFVGIFVATIFGGGFFFDLFWPERKESNSVKIAWKICSVLACLCITAVSIAATAIVALRSAYITGVDEAQAQHLMSLYGSGEPLVYRKNPRAVASLVFTWIGFVAVIASTIILWMSLAYIDRYGPFSSHVGGRSKQSPGAEDEELSETKIEESNAPPSDPTAQPGAATSNEPIGVHEGT